MRQSNLNGGANYEQNKQIAVEGGYQPSDYANLPVSMEVKELFKSIQRQVLVNAGTPQPSKKSIPS